jgi:hypothetical protein
MTRRGALITLAISAALYLVAAFMHRGTGWQYIDAGGAIIAIVIIIYEILRGDRETKRRKP